MGITNKVAKKERLVANLSVVDVREIRIRRFNKLFLEITGKDISTYPTEMVVKIHNEMLELEMPQWEEFIKKYSN